MLFANVKNFNFDDYDKLQKAVSFLRDNDLTKTPIGKSHEEGKSFYCQTLEYDTEDIQNVPFEVHEKRLDLHYIVKGEEEIDISPDTIYSPSGVYNSVGDLQYVVSPKIYTKLILHEGDFVLIGMHEPHRTNGLVLGKSCHVRKIVLKLGR